MKKTLTFILALMLMLALTAGAMAEDYPILTGESGLYNAGVYQVKERGMGGYMTMLVTFGTDTIDAIEITKHTETPNIGTRAIDAIIPAIIEAQDADVDTYAGATITSEAIKAAVKKAIAAALAPEKAEPIYVAGTYQVKERGMGGYITMDVTFSETAIEAIEIVKHTETPNIGTRAIDAILPAIIEAQSVDVDTYAGATITSEALKVAVQKAIDKALIPVEKAIYVAGTYQVKERGMGGYITMDVTFSETAIEKIEIVKHTETPNIGTRAIDAILPAIIEAQSVNVDTYAGATITSEALKVAVQKAIDKAAIAQ